MDITLIRGDSWTTVFSLKDPNSPVNPNSPRDPINLTGATARLQLRKVATPAVVSLLCTTSNTKIVLSALLGKLSMSVPPADTVALLGKYLYDLEVTFADGTVMTVVQGTLTVLADITYD